MGSERIEVPRPRSSERARSPASPMRPLLLGMEWFPNEAGGLNRYFYDLLRSLREQQAIEARAVVLRPADGLPAYVEAGPDRAAFLPARLWHYARAATRQAHGATLVDSHFALYGCVALAAGAARGRPFIVHFQGPWADESRTAGRGSVLAFMARRALERATYRRADRIVVLSAAFKRIVVERYGVRPWDVEVVPPGVDIDRFSDGSRGEARAALGVPLAGHIVVTVRRLTPRTGVELLLEAWAASVGGRDEALLLVAGEGPLRGLLEARARALGVERSVRFLGRVDEEELVACYRAADFCVVPSVALEGFGLVVLEALASGRPVIASDVGGLPEALSGLGGDLVVPGGDVGALASRLLRAFEEPGALPSGEECRAHAEKFSWNRISERHLRLYADAAAGRRSSLRVAYVDHCAQLSGAEIALLRLLPSLVDVEPHVVLAEDGPLAGRLAQSGISFEILPMPHEARGFSRNRVRPSVRVAMPAAASAVHVARLAARLRRLQPDLVHTNTLKAAIYGGLAGRIAGVPVVWHLRDRIADDYLPASAVTLVRAFARFLPTGLIANSQATLETLAAASRRRDLPSAVIHDPLAARAARPPAARETTQLRVGMVGRIAPWKGQHVFLRAFARAFPQGEELAVVVGAPLFGEFGYEQSLRDLVRALGIEPRVQFTGFRHDVDAELARLDLLVHASITPEPFGQVVVEGMASGLLVIATAGGGPLEVIEDGVTGLLTPPGDVAALARTLRRAADDSELRARLGAAARERAMDFDGDQIGPRVAALYRRVLAGNRPGLAPSRNV